MTWSGTTLLEVRRTKLYPLYDTNVNVKLAATTQGGALRLTLEKALPQNNHNLSYRSGMVGSLRLLTSIGIDAISVH